MLKPPSPGPTPRCGGEAFVGEILLTGRQMKKKINTFKGGGGI